MTAPSPPAVTPPAPTRSTPTWLRVGATVAAGRLRPPVGGRRHRTICGAARVLTGLGVRVEVHVPATAWPRTGTGLLLVSNTATALDPLALLTVVPGAAVAGVPDRLAGVPVPAVPAVSARIATSLRLGTSVSVRPEEGVRSGPGLGRFSPALLTAAVDAGAACARSPSAGAARRPRPLADARRWRRCAGWPPPRALSWRCTCCPPCPPPARCRRSWRRPPSTRWPPSWRPRPRPSPRLAPSVRGVRRTGSSHYSVTRPSSTAIRRGVSTAASSRRSWVTSSSVPR